ncbi:2-isopropylmalate synthase [Actinocrinis puniceicyclus]|uniref:2-isopropylmalate synthase n=1 Tax=Actinocrinis puniceicyclus TaxID=977794 RepID=A0A8J7WMX9_9ACTN|nr:2-isopropylmalate synthase [Actinocrinis puniceicyclus]MBS2963695.1 2-isopropylmalate synthase [Actinocrinis puniceicyclus]
MSGEDGHRRYRPFPTVDLPQRSWPGRTQDRAPRWLSTDLRDGNQALIEPMSPKRKLALFELLVEIGYKEIEVGFPSADAADHEFIRMLIEQDRVPEDVLISVLVPARAELIRGTVEALRGARSAGIHLYNATCPTFRSVVFGMSRAECRALAVEGARLTAACCQRLLPGTEVRYQYSPELFNETEADFALDVCEAVMDVWEPGEGREIILNFPATVERATPNVFADQIEWLERNLSRREHVCLSVHPHNDRGTAVAAAELAVLAGAQRVEGCLLGGGERAGNVDLITLGLNLYTQGVDPGIDFSDLDRIRAIVEECTGQRVHPRQPYVGDLVYSAFSGSHQDAINKGFADAGARTLHTGTTLRNQQWRIPYLPIDPEDVGRSYDALVRITSQSGKGGIAYLMNARHGLRLPRELQIDFARHVQAVAEQSGGEVTPERLRACFESVYVRVWDEPTPLTTGREPILAAIYVDPPAGRGRTPLAEDLVGALAPWGVLIREVNVLDACPDAGARAGDVAVYASCLVDGRTVWGAGLHRDEQVATYTAVRAAVARYEESMAPVPASM